MAMHARPSSHRRALLGGLLVAAGAAGAAGLATGSDHQDTPDVELNPKMDMTDVYVFPSPTPGRIVLVMNSRAFLTPAQAADPVQGSFDPDLLYQFKVDNDNDYVEDRVIQVTFSGTGAAQQAELRGPVAPPVQGAMMNQIADVSAAVTGGLAASLGSADGIQLFAGPRDRPSSTSRPPSAPFPTGSRSADRWRRPARSRRIRARHSTSAIPASTTSRASTCCPSWSSCRARR
jgi:hypothetical protein